MAESAEALFGKRYLSWLLVGGTDERGYPGQKTPPKGRLRTRAGSWVALLFPTLPGTAPSPPKGSLAATRVRRLGGTTVAVHLDRTSDDSDTSFPSRVSIFFTTTAFEEPLRLKEPAGPKLDWKALRP